MDVTVTKKRDWRIELLRFVATIGIAIFHFEWIYIGQPIFFRHFYLWVEFFFVLSGFFLAKNVKTADEDEYSSLKYCYNQAKKLFPEYLIGFAFSFIVYCLVNNISEIKNVIYLLWQSKWEIVYMQLSGIDPTAPMINGVTGYIPALLASGLIIHYLLNNYYKLTLNLVSVFAPIFIYSHIVNIYGNLSQWLNYENWYTVGILRGLAGMLLGVLAYEMVCYIRSSKGGCSYCRIITLFCLIMISALVFWREHINFYDEVLYPYIFAVCIGSIYVEKAREINNKIEHIILFCGKISLNIFVIHYGICYLLKYYIPEKRYVVMAPIYITIVLFVACGMEIAVKHLRRIIWKQ